MSDQFTLYHGHACPSDIEDCRAAAGHIRHGIEWSDPVRMVDRDEPYMLDNGAYNGFEASTFCRLLERASQLPRAPDFVVLPDVMDDWEATVERHREWYEHVRSFGFDYYAVAQPRATEAQIRELVHETNADGVFIGGSNMEYKHMIAGRLGGSLNVHIGNPGLGCNLRHAADVADSADTTSIVVNDYYHHLENMGCSQRLTDAVQKTVEYLDEQLDQ